MKNVFKKIIVWILTLEARLVLLKYKPRTIGITGSVGKTSTKDAIYTVLESSFYVRKSQKSFNSEIGLPLTILGCDNAWDNPFLWLKNILIGLGMVLLPNHYPKWLVLEIGLDRPKDILNVIQWLQLDVAVFTRLADVPVHVEFFESAEALREEKRALVRGLKKHGVLVVNADDPHLQEVRHPHGGRRLTYGVEQKADIQATHIEVLQGKREGEERLEGINFKIEYDGSIIPVNLLSVLGRQHIYPALAAIAVGVSQQSNIVTMGQALERHQTAPGRMRIIEGIHGSILIDDSYNSSPVALHTALETLEGLSVQGRKIAVLGDMTELGAHATDEHKAIGKHIGKHFDMLVTVGPRAHYFAEGAREAGMSKTLIHEYSNSREAGRELRNLIESGDLVLIKGSQSMRMERITKALLAHPETAEQLLVRQDSVWLGKE